MSKATKKWEDMTFEEQIQHELQQAVLKKVRDGNFIEIDYKDRQRVPTSFIKEAWAKVDYAAVVERMTERMTTHVADSMYNAMATEIASDVKQIMSNNELREDVRAMIRAKIREGQAALKVSS